MGDYIVTEEQDQSFRRRFIQEGWEVIYMKENGPRNQILVRSTRSFDLRQETVVYVSVDKWRVKEEIEGFNTGT